MESSEVSVYEAIWSIITHNYKQEIEAATLKLIDESISTKKTAVCVNYNYLATKYAYFYLYFTINFYTFLNIWQKFDNEFTETWYNHMAEKSEMRVLALGGGSGCEMLALYEWLRIKEKKIKLAGVLLDNCDWSTETRLVKSKFNIYDQFTACNYWFINADFFQKDFYVGFEFELNRTDLITIVNFLSSANYDFDIIYQRLKKLFINMALNTYVLYIDNTQESCSQIMAKAATDAKLCYVNSIKDSEIKLPAHEKAMMEEYCFDKSAPLKTMSVNASLWRKSIHYDFDLFLNSK